MDRVLVIVNEDIITQSEYDYRLKSILSEAKRNEKQLPSGDITKQLLDGMVSDRLQLQEAKRRGLEIGDAELDAAMQRFSANQNMTPQQLSESLALKGEVYSRFKETIRESMMISRLTDYYARTRVVVPDYEIDGFIAQNKLNDDNAEYKIAHILIKNPDQNRQLAEKVLAEIRDGLSFQQAALTYSEATDAQDGGLLGWRKAEQLPEVFAVGIKFVQVGAVTDVLKSSNGLHILKLLDMKGERDEVIQNQVRHILISARTEIARSQASKRLLKLRQRIVQGEEFSSLARIYSDDSVSAANGGSLGWVSPGEMVPVFEESFKQLPLNEISQPFSSQYGVHLLEVTDRRQKNITDQLIRGRADNFLRRRRAEREFQQWVRELKEQAYIEFISVPSSTI